MNFFYHIFHRPDVSSTLFHHLSHLVFSVAIYVNVVICLSCSYTETSICSQDLFNNCKRSCRQWPSPDLAHLINLNDDLKIGIQLVAKCRVTRQNPCESLSTCFISQRTCTTLTLQRTRHLLAMHVSNNLWKSQNSDFTVFRVSLVVHSGLNPYY